MTPEEIDQKLSAWLNTHKKHVMVLDFGTEKEYHYHQITWQEFFINLYHIKKDSGTLIIIKQKKGPIIIWSEK